MSVAVAESPRLHQMPVQTARVAQVSAETDRYPAPRQLPSAEESIAQVERSHGRALRGYLTGLAGGDYRRAEDIYQETMIRAWKHPEQRDSAGRYGRQWLFTVGRRICIDQYRAAGRRPAEVPDDELAARSQGQDRIERLLTAGEVKAALGTLSLQHREVIYEMYFMDRPATEVAERLGIPLGTVKSRTYYALRHLKNALAERGHSPLLAS
jgi:RNA polymerase sigma-70 factor (ECF subfamily)